jgi:glycine hydroxymethyltransferase
LTNKYSEGYPAKRYYGGNEYIDQIEVMCQERALAAYGLDPAKWGVNVQPYSGSPANFAVYTGLLRPHDRIMGLDLPSGGHLTHGFYTYSKADNCRKAVSATSVYFESLPYRISPTTGYIDYDALAAQAALFKPALIIGGGSAYPREWEHAKFRQIADENGSLYMFDMAHISGLVATGEAASPFEYADVVTTTTHKSLRGPRAGVIFYRKDDRNFENRIAAAVFPGLQGGPHVHQIAGIATQLKEVATEDFKQYSRQVRANAKAIADELITIYGYTLATGGTENHLILWDLKPQGVTGSKMQTVCDHCSITLNKNAVLGDRSALTPGGVRIGTPALTTRGLKESDFRKVGGFLHKALQIAINLQTSAKTLKDFEAAVIASGEVKALKKDIQEFITQFPMPGFDTATMKYKGLDI